MKLEKLLVLSSRWRSAAPSLFGQTVASSVVERLSIGGRGCCGRAGPLTNTGTGAVRQASNGQPERTGSSNWIRDLQLDDQSNRLQE